MTLRLATGHVTYHDAPDFWSERRFKLRELFLAVARHEVPDAFRDFGAVVSDDVARVFASSHDRAALRAILAERELAWDWGASESPRYARAFGGWPPPTPTGTIDRLTLETVRITRTCELCWAFHGWLLARLLEEALDAWSERWHLARNPWVACHLLARSAKPRFLALHGETDGTEALDHLVFPSPGVLADFPGLLAEHLPGDPPMRHWDPTQELWSTWRKEATSRLPASLRRSEAPVAFREYRMRVEMAARQRGLQVVREKREVGRDLAALARSLLLRESADSLLLRFDFSKGRDALKAAEKAIERAADDLGLAR